MTSFSRLAVHWVARLSLVEYATARYEWNVLSLIQLSIQSIVILKNSIHDIKRVATTRRRVSRFHTKGLHHQVTAIEGVVVLLDTD